jgi:hypothetical protein
MPILTKHALYKCASCVHAKLTRRPHEHTQEPKQPTTSTPPEIATQTNAKTVEATQCGQHFCINYGFLRGSSYYCLIVDRKSMYTWVFLTKNKSPPLEIITQFLTQHGCITNQRKTIRTDEGAELWNSHNFRQVVLEKRLPIGAHSGRSPKPKRTGWMSKPDLREYGSMPITCIKGESNFNFSNKS